MVLISAVRIQMAQHSAAAVDGERSAEMPIDLSHAAVQHRLCNAAWRSAMTFFAPEADGGKGSVLPYAFPVDKLWTSWFEAAKPTAIFDQALAFQREMAAASLSLLALPFTLLGAADEGGAPTVHAPEPHAVVIPPSAVVSSAQASVDDVEGVAPALYAEPDGKPDDLLAIKGIGPKLNQLLNSLGVWHYRQIVGWTPAEVAWVNAKIDFKGRIQRERWQAQAAALLKPAKAA
jgi:predicted flap endonuclease-1-like 5' DNA nuclease